MDNKEENNKKCIFLSLSKNYTTKAQLSFIKTTECNGTHIHGLNSHPLILLLRKRYFP